MGMSQHLSWVVGDFYSESVEIVWIMCSALVEDLRSESVGYDLPVLDPDRAAELAFLADTFFSPGLFTSYT